MEYYRCLCYHCLFYSRPGDEGKPVCCRYPKARKKKPNDFCGEWVDNVSLLTIKEEMERMNKPSERMTPG